MAKIVLGSIKKRIVASDLLQERANCDFDAQNGNAISNILEPKTQAKLRELKNAMVNDPELANSHKFYDMSRAE